MHVSTMPIDVRRKVSDPRKLKLQANVSHLLWLLGTEEEYVLLTANLSLQPQPKNI